MEVSDLNKLLKMHRQMADMMKKMGKGGMLKKMMGMMGKGGADPSQMDPAQLEAAARQMGSMKMPGLPGGITPPAGMLGRKK
jgi:signal recognition particle subunit SRP54